MQSIRLVFSETVALINEVSDPTRVAQIVGLLLALFSTYYILREVISLLRDFVQSQIGKPQFVGETSHQLSIVSFIKRPFVLLTGSAWRKDIEQNTAELKALFHDVILSTNLKRESSSWRCLRATLASRGTLPPPPPTWSTRHR